MSGLLSGLATLRNVKSRRVSSFDRTGGNSDRVPVEPGDIYPLAELSGAGQIVHIWITIDCPDPLYRRNLILRCYWDGEEHPSVEAPIGDFFGNGWGQHYNFSTPPLAYAPAGGKAHVCYFPMPFGKGARIELENQSDQQIRSLYYYVDYEEWESCPDDLGRFHASYRQELTKPESEQGDIENEWSLFGEAPKNPSDANNYVFAEIEGRGHFVGVNYYIHCPTPLWYGEGDDMFLIDGEAWPGSLHGTGTEDYFNMAWCPREPFSHPYFGFGYLPGGNLAQPNDERLGWLGRTHCYRFHISDPIHFQKSLRASIEHGHGNVLTLELASVAYWYQTEPHLPFPALPEKAARVPLPEIKAVEIHRWRDVWRREHGGGDVWGTEVTKP